MTSLPHYAELHCLSNFTFLRGASHPEELVARAAQLGYAALAITDECSLAGVVRAYQKVRELKDKEASDRGEDAAPTKTTPIVPKLIIGSEIRLADGPRLVLLAMDRVGYGRLSTLITRGRRAADKGGYHLTRDDVADGVPGCLALWVPDGDKDSDIEQARWIAKTFPDRAWIALELLGGPDDRRKLRRLERLGERVSLPLLAAGDVHMHTRGRRALQDTLTAIRLNVPVAEAGYALHPNGERHLRLRARLARIYPAALLGETLRVAGRCTFSLDELRYEYPEELVPHDETPTTYLRKVTYEGLHRRWPAGAPRTVLEQIDHELRLIEQLGYEPYFLTVFDIVRFARARGILCQGRGSAANSAVCYCLGITEVDPSRMAMLFERFVSAERNEPPDIDVDFEHERREEVIQYLYRKYGRDRAAMAATVITYRARSALRDVGKALGLDAHQVERLAGCAGGLDTNTIDPERLREAGFDPDNPRLKRIAVLAGTLLGFPRHLSQHVGGMVVARGPLPELVPVENAAMDERTVIQWDKDDLDAVGLLKVDCLGLGMLSAVRRAFDIIERFRGKRWTLASLPAEDPAVYRMIQQADTVGVFQIESRAQMAMLPRLRPENFYDLVIEVSIVRPGPIQGDMVHPYLRRRQGLEAVDYPSEEVREVLERTLGVPLFQEQVIQLAMVAAGFTPGEADQLRRAMAAWRRRGGLGPFRERLIAGMRERGYPADFAERLYQQILGFGEYGFPESHAASFALLVYASAWLKCHEPAAFACALLNSQPMGFYPPHQLVADARSESGTGARSASGTSARRHGVEVRPVDVHASEWGATLERRPDGEPALRLGLQQVKGLSTEGAARLVAARAIRPFTDVTDLVNRAQLDKGDREALAAADALSGLAGHRHAARWQVQGVEPYTEVFQGAAPEEVQPDLLAPTEGENLVADYAHLGLSLGRHPLALLRERITRLNAAPANRLHGVEHGQAVRVAGLVTTRQRPSAASGTIFLTLEDETGSVNVIVWRDLAAHRRRIVLQGRLVVVNGVVEREGEVMHLIARALEDRSALLGALDTPSRDFH